MYRLFFLVALLSLVVFDVAHAQKVTISQEVLLKDESAYSLLGKIDDRILLLRNKPMMQELSIYDEGLGFIQTVPIDLEERKEYLLGVAVSEYDFNIFYSFRDQGERILKCVKLNKRGEVLLADTIEMLRGELMEGYYSFNTSENERYVAMFQDTRDNGFKFLVYDIQEMELVSVGELEMENIDSRRDFRNLEVSNRGEIYALFERYGYKFKLSSHYLHCLYADKQGVTTQYKIPMTDMFMIDSKVVIDNQNGQAHIVGLYGENYDNVSEGYFISDLETIIYESYMTDNQDLVINQEVHLKNGLENYRLMDVVLRQDGGMLFVVEKNMEFFRSSPYGRDPMSGYRSGIVDYIAEDIFLINAMPDGLMAWKLVLPKRQISQDDGGAYSSYFLFKNRSKLHFIFNDEIKTNNTVSEYVVNPVGVFERNALMSTANQKLKLRLKSAIQISADTFLLISERGNRLNIVKVQY